MVLQFTAIEQRSGAGVDTPPFSNGDLLRVLRFSDVSGVLQEGVWLNNEDRLLYTLRLCIDPAGHADPLIGTVHRSDVSVKRNRCTDHTEPILFTLPAVTRTAACEATYKHVLCSDLLN